MTPVLKGRPRAADACPMSRVLRLLLVTAAFALTLALPAGAHAAARLAMAEQNPEFFSDPRFRQLGIRDARLVVSWDVMSSHWELEQIDQWLSDARREGVNPMVTFAHS